MIISKGENQKIIIEYGCMTQNRAYSETISGGRTNL
jgi:hypothetical protein